MLYIRKYSSMSTFIIEIHPSNVNCTIELRQSHCSGLWHIDPGLSPCPVLTQNRLNTGQRKQRFFQLVQYLAHRVAMSLSNPSNYGLDLLGSTDMGRSVHLG
jgi:hypothetical protein